MIALKKVSYCAVITASAALMTLSPAAAQTVAPKKIFDNEKLTIFDNILKPGEESASASRGGMIYYYVQGGTVERTFADGTKTSVTRKTGESFQNPEKRPYAVKNTGGSTIHVISIQLK
ncbi:MAG TPA: hypothetical protein VN175_01160 [Rhizomicrobium sp.]|nr:hypothetical protein [Rhizomicrobium sp.]